MALNYLLIAVLMFGAVLAQSEPSISDTLASLPPELQGKVNESDVQEVKNKSIALFKEKCLKNGDQAAFENAQKAYEVFPQCVKDSFGLSDPAVLQREIENAKPNGTVDEVFKRYCAKTPEAKKCFKAMTDAVKPCFSADEQKNLKTVYNITEQLAEFICYKDGDRIALFIAEGGPECFQEKTEEIQQCVNSTLGVQLQLDTANISASSLPNIAFGADECGKISELQRCFVGALEKCHAPTSANIVESLFKFAVKATPCKNINEAKVAKASSRRNVTANPNSASGLAVTSATLAIAFAATLLY